MRGEGGGGEGTTTTTRWLLAARDPAIRDAKQRSRSYTIGSYRNRKVLGGVYTAASPGDIRGTVGSLIIRFFPISSELSRLDSCRADAARI